MAYRSPFAATGTLRDAFAGLPAGRAPLTLPPPGQHTYATDRVPAGRLRRFLAPTRELPYPTDRFEPLDHYALLTTEAGQLEDWSTLTPGAGEVLLAVRLPTSGGDRDVRFHLRGGRRFLQVCREILALERDREMVSAVEDRLGKGAWKSLGELVRDGEVTGTGLDLAAGWNYFLGAINSLRSLGYDLATKLERRGWVGANLPATVRKLLAGPLRAVVTEYAAAGLSEAGASATALLAGGQTALSGFLATVEKALRLAPPLPWLLGQLYRSCDRALNRGGRLLGQIEALREARATFEREVVLAAGKGVWAELRDGPDASTQAQMSQVKELAIGGVMIGQLPFLIGTVYQIVADLVMTFIDLIRYGIYGMRGLAGMIYGQLTAPATEESIPPDPGLAEAFLSGFSPAKFLEEDLPAALTGLGEIVTQLVDNFVLHAADYGKTVGYYLGQGILAAGGGVLGLITSGYPTTGGLVERIWWNVRQWFNVGTVLGPVLVDVVLLFCSGGASGIFSAATKIGKLGKVQDAFRFLGRGKVVADKMLEVARQALRIPDRLRELLERLLRQAYAVTSRVSDLTATLLKSAALRFGIDFEADDALAIGRQLDTVYDVAGASHFALSIAFMFVGPEHAAVSAEGKMTAT